MTPHEALKAAGNLLRFASNDLDRYVRPPCPRCGATSVCDFVEDGRWGEPVVMYKPNRHWCETPGCVDEQGFNVVPRRSGD